MGEGVVRDLEDDSLKVFDQSQGKLIVYATSCYHFTVDISWASIETLQERSKMKFFGWTIDDRSLLVQGQGDCWTLAFRTNGLSSPLVPVFLSAVETKTVKDYLFTR
jgi:hypothetical protein